MKNKKDKSMCRGCNDNFYNGNNDLNVKECWSYKDATIIKKIQVSINESPPYSRSRAGDTLSCYRKKGYAFIPLNTTGYTLKD